MIYTLVTVKEKRNKEKKKEKRNLKQNKKLIIIRDLYVESMSKVEIK